MLATCGTANPARREPVDRPGESFGESEMTSDSPWPVRREPADCFGESETTSDAPRAARKELPDCSGETIRRNSVADAEAVNAAVVDVAGTEAESAMVVDGVGFTGQARSASPEAQPNGNSPSRSLN